jgi:tetratricopeptide (TPR) repeat protein
MPALRTIVAGAVAFAAALALFTTNARNDPDLAGARPDRGPGRLSTDARIAAIRRAVQAKPDARRHAALAAALLQKARETGDPAVYVEADRSIRAALESDPRHPAALLEAASLAASRHRFTRALRLARRAHAAVPYSTSPYGVIVDSLVELGRLPEAADALQAMVDRKPTLAAYSRVSYVRELRGDLRGAERAMLRAVSAGGDVPENSAGVYALLGHIQLAQGRVDDAEHAYRSALYRYPVHRPSLAGIAQITAARGDLPAAIREYGELVARSPAPADAVALGEAQLAAGDEAGAARSFAAARRKARAFEAAGFDVRGELAEFEADHGDPALAVRLARRAYRAAPNGHHGEAVGWTLTRTGRPELGLPWLRRSLRGGDAHAYYHAAIAARETGRSALAKRWLEHALGSEAVLGPLKARHARAALAAL